MTKHPVPLLVSLLATAVSILAQTTQPLEPGEIDRAYLMSHFQKHEYDIPMRDGIHLHTAVYVPSETTKSPLPIILIRTPYGIGGYGDNQWPDPKYELRWFAHENFIFAFQDVRGRNHSQGVFVHVRPLLNPGEKGIDESTDAWDTVDFLVKNIPQNNGRVALVGLSYPGFYALEGAIHPHPAIQCAIPQAPVVDWFTGDDLHHNGAFCLAQSYPFLASMAGKPVKEGLPDGYAYYLRLGAVGLLANNVGGFWDEVMTHETNDNYWQTRDVRPHVRDITVPTMLVGGWFDAEDLFGTLAAYRHGEKATPDRVNVLVMGPWSHGQWQRDSGEQLGDIKFDSKTAEWYRRQVELPFLKKYLEPDASPNQTAEATVFETGANRWRTYSAWPPEKSVERSLYLHADGRLSFDPPLANEAPFDQYISNPNKPVPYVGKITMKVVPEFMDADQRFASQRPDVLVYQTDVLAHDLEIAGPVTVTLIASTTGTDSDWVVKLIDVYPDDAKDPQPNPIGLKLGGDQQLVRGDLMRGKFRDGLDKGVPFESGKVSKVDFIMADVCHQFRAGHRLMIQVQSSWFPLFDRNPQVFCDIYHAPPEDYQKAMQRIYHTPDETSAIRVRVMPKDPAE